MFFKIHLETHNMGKRGEYLTLRRFEDKDCMGDAEWVTNDIGVWGWTGSGSYWDFLDGVCFANLGSL